MTAVRDSWRALWSSRLLVWVAGVGTVLAFGFGPERKAFNPPGVTSGFGWLGNLLAAPAARWDCGLVPGDRPLRLPPRPRRYTSSRTAFFPLYPLGLRSDRRGSASPPVLAGVLLSVAAFALALYGIHRLTTLELARGARPSLARRSRRAGGAPGGAADGVRADGVLLLGGVLGVAVPGAVGGAVLERAPRALDVGRRARGARRRDAQHRPGAAAAGADHLPVRAARGPSRRISARRELGAGGCARATGCAATCCGWRCCRSAWSSTAPTWRSPAATRWRRCTPRKSGAGTSRARTSASGTALRAAFEGARQLLSGQRQHIYFPTGEDSPFVMAGHNLMLLAFLRGGDPGDRRRAAQAAARLRRLRDRGAGAAALLPGRLAAADVAAALPAGAVPARHLARGWLPSVPRLQRPALVALGGADGVLPRPVRHLALGGVGDGRRRRRRGRSRSPDYRPGRAWIGAGRAARRARARDGRRRCVLEIPAALLFGVKLVEHPLRRRACRSPTPSCRTSAFVLVAVYLRADRRADRALVAVRPAPPRCRVALGRTVWSCCC